MSSTQLPASDKYRQRKQRQEPIGTEPGWVDELLAEAVTTIVDEAFPPVVEEQRGSRGSFASACPGTAEGRQVVE